VFIGVRKISTMQFKSSINRIYFLAKQSVHFGIIY
jgi:hypothetical protein